LTLALLLAVACGSAAAPETDSSPPDTSAPITSGDVPTPVAQPADPSEPMGETLISPGRLTVMVGEFQSGRFDTNYNPSGKDIRKNFHGHLTSWEEVDGAMKIAPGIASKWELSNGGMTTTFTIMKGARFHDGSEITVDDVLWTLQHGMGKQAPDYSKSSPGINYATIMDRIELGPGPDQVSVTTTVPSPELAVYISENEGGATQGQVLPARELLHSEADVEAYEANPIGAGPGKLVKVVPLESVLFERFGDFYYQPANGFPTDKRYQFTELELRLVPEEATRAAALRSNEADIGQISQGQASQVEAGGGSLQYSPEAVIVESHMWGCWKPEFNCSDVRVRQALNYAVDKELLRDRLFGGPEAMAIKGWWVVTPSTIGYSPELDPWPYDPGMARQLLAEAGYRTPDNPAGQDFGKLVINTYADGLIPALIESAQLTADMWKNELGIDTEVRVMDKVTFNNIRTLNFEQLDGTVNFAAQNTRLDAAGVTRLYFLTPLKGGPSSRVNADPEIFALVEDALSKVGTDNSEAALNSLFLRLRDESYQVNLGYLNSPWGVGPRVEVWDPYAVCEYACALHTIVLN
jgi:ABC-type transport system substrate-binding protein